MRICSGAGCLRAVEDNVRFCDECNPGSGNDGIRTHTYGYTLELDALRKSKRWQMLRALVLQAAPMCARCGLKRAVEVDHIVPAGVAVAQAKASGKYSGLNAGYFIRGNLQGLCRSCHAQKTIEDKAHVGPWPDVVAIEDAKPKKTWTF